MTARFCCRGGSSAIILIHCHSFEAWKPGHSPVQKYMTKIGFSALSTSCWMDVVRLSQTHACLGEFLHRIARGDQAAGILIEPGLFPGGSISEGDARLGSG